MEFIYKHAAFPKNDRLLKRIDEAASRLHEKIKRLHVDTLKISEYSKTYFGNHIRNLHSTLQRYAHVLAWALAGPRENPEDAVLLDYGGGTGLLSLLAKEYRVGKVIYNDIYDVSCEDAKVIGSTMENEADFYVCGDMEETCRFLKSNNIRCHSIASCDVLEHIYDLEGYFRRIRDVGNGYPLNVSLSSNANMFNLFTRKRIERIQREFEHRDREYRHGHKQRDSLKSFFAIRKEMIRDYADGLKEFEVEKLAKATRGMMKQDIQKAVDAFPRTGAIPEELEHPTNTCDPYTGNWTEHLVNPYDLKAMLVREGFQVDVVPGHYGEASGLIKYLAGTILNVCIKYSRDQGIRIAPNFVICGTRFS